MTIFDELASRVPEIKFGAAKKLLLIAKERPIELYPHFDYFIELLNSENRILKWTAIDVIGHLAGVDSDHKISNIQGKLFALLNSGNLITANHAISALAHIASVDPAYRKDVTRELLQIERYSFETDECRNIALGKVVLALGSYFNSLADKQPALEFVRRQTQNTRNATRKKAEEFLRQNPVPGT